MVTVTIIGVGRVGGAIAISLPTGIYFVENLIVRDNRDVSSVVSRMSRAPRVLGLDDLDKIGSDVVLITTQDGQILSASKALATSGAKPAAVYHTSGSYPSSVLEELRSAGWETGSIHPLVSISVPEFGPKRFPGSYFCVEGTPAALEIGTNIVEALGGRPFSIETRFKTLYHAAAVTACGHLVALFDASVEMMTKCGLSAAKAKEILMPLVVSTVENLEEQDTAAALTGTFARADSETLTRHLTALNENVSEALIDIYLTLGERSLELAASQGISSEKIESMRTKVLIAKSKLKW